MKTNRNDRYVPPSLSRFLRGAKNILSRFLFSFLAWKTGREMDRSKYSLIISESTYSPWISDRPFQHIFSQVRQHTMLGEYKAYELWHLAKQVAFLPGHYLEVGVWRGGSGCLIAAAASASRRSNPVPATVYLCDTFSGVVKSSDKDPVFKGGELEDTSPEIVLRLLSSLDLSNARILKGIFPDETGDQISDLRFKFCHVDVDTYLSAKDVTEWIWERMVHGGVIVYDDFGGFTTPGVTKWVEEQYDNGDRLVIQNLNGHALVVKIQ